MGAGLSMGEKILTFLGRSDTWIVGSALACSSS